jgi:hypothetical protein
MPVESPNGVAWRASRLNPVAVRREEQSRKAARVVGLIGPTPCDSVIQVSHLLAWNPPGSGTPSTESVLLQRVSAQHGSGTPVEMTHL